MTRSNTANRNWIQTMNQIERCIRIVNGLIQTLTRISIQMYARAERVLSVSERRSKLIMTVTCNVILCYDDDSALPDWVQAV